MSIQKLVKTNYKNVYIKKKDTSFQFEVSFINYLPIVAARISVAVASAKYAR